MPEIIVYSKTNNEKFNPNIIFSDIKGNTYALEKNHFYIAEKLKPELKKGFETYSSESIFVATINDNSKISHLTFIEKRISPKVDKFIKKNHQNSAKQNYALIINKVANFVMSKFSLLNSQGSELEWPYDNETHFSALIKKQQLELNNKLICSNTYLPLSCSLTLINRLAIGLGNESIYETGIFFHPIYGIPYIPASSIKGVVRNYFLDRYFQLTDKEINENNERADKDKITPEKKAFHDAGFCFLFGADKDSITGARQGAIVFMDSFPDENLNIEPDIVNPHYKNYYDDIEGNTPPGDWMNPVPIIFLTATGATFEFTILGKKYKDMQLHNITYKTIDEQGRPLDKTIGENTWIENGQPIQIMLDHLKIALKENGIGAKTAVDYGKFI